MMNTTYELILVFDPNLDEAGMEEQIEKVTSIITSHSGSVFKKDPWGRRQLAYKIANREYGQYVMLIFDAEESVVSDLNRQLRINEAVLRHLVVLKDRHAPDISKPPEEERPRTRRPDAYASRPYRQESYRNDRAEEKESGGADEAEKPAADGVEVKESVAAATSENVEESTSEVSSAEG